MTQNSPPRLQVALPRHLGDAVMALPALRLLGRSLPEWEIVPIGPIWLHEVVAGQGQWGAPSRDFLPAASRRSRLEVALLLAPSFGVALRAWRAGTHRRIGRPSDWRGLLVEGGPWPEGPLPKRGLPALLPQEHQRESYLQVVGRAVNLLGGRHQGELIGDRDFVLSEEDKGAANELWRAVGCPQLILHPWAEGLRTKRWSKQRWGDLVRGLKALGVHALVTGGPGRDDCSFAESIAAGSGFSLKAGKEALSLRRWAALSRIVGAVVGPDTGLMHLAAAAGAKGIVLFGPTDPRRHRPGGPNVEVLQPTQLPPCSPCYRNRCLVSGHASCIDLISEVDVLRALAIEGASAA